MENERQDKDFSAFQSPHEASVERLIQALDRAYHRPAQLMWRSFLQGFMSAIGAAIGTILIFSVIVYVVQAAGGLELLRPGLTKLQDMLIPKELREMSAPSSNQDVDALLQQLQNQPK